MSKNNTAREPDDAASKVCKECGITLYLLCYDGLGFKVKNSGHMFNKPNISSMFACPGCSSTVSETAEWAFKYNWAFRHRGM